MANTTPLTYRIDTDLKEGAESILYSLGMTPTVAIQMFYKQVILNRGLPFDAKLKSYPVPIAAGSLSAEELDAELTKGCESLRHDRKYSPDEVDALLAKEFGSCGRDIRSIAKDM